MRIGVDKFQINLKAILASENLNKNLKKLRNNKMIPFNRQFLIRIKLINIKELQRIQN